MTGTATRGASDGAKCAVVGLAFSLFVMVVVLAVGKDLRALWPYVLLAGAFFGVLFYLMVKWFRQMQQAK